MKIVVNALSARLGGGQTYLRNLFAHLPAEPALEIVVFAPDSLELPADARVRRERTAWPTTNPLLRAVWERWRLPAWLARNAAQLLFCPGGVVATRPPPGCRVATMFRNMIPFDMRARRSMPLGRQRLRNWLLQRVMLRTMVRADLTIFISAHARALIETLTPLRAAVTIPHGSGAAFRSHGATLARPAQAPAGRYLLYVSRFDVYKHHHELVEGYARLSPALRAAHPLMLVGETDSPEARRVRALIERLQLGAHVHIVGEVAYRELPAWYHHAEAIVFASSCENCPNILLEALGAGRPIACSNVAPMPEFGGDAVEYFTPFDTRDVQRALQRLLTDADHAMRLGNAAAARSLQYDSARSAHETWHRLLALADS
jgi:glycosyltransferase involved in cell wall biosynthesis